MVGHTVSVRMSTCLCKYRSDSSVLSTFNSPLFRGFKPRLFTNPLLWLHNLFFPYTAKEKAGFVRENDFQRFGSGYSSIQNTKPQTLGYALADSPVGLLAWIYEKLKDWTDDYEWNKDESKMLFRFIYLNCLTNLDRCCHSIDLD